MDDKDGMGGIALSAVVDDTCCSDDGGTKGDIFCLACLDFMLYGMRLILVFVD